MNKKVFKYLDMLFTKSENPKGLYALQKLFLIGIPFNKPHGITFQKITKNESRFKMAYKRLNQNHLKGIHACAQCTLGEYAAGILLSKNFPTAKYRVIMKELHAEYYKQARSEIYGSAKLTDDQILDLKSQIEAEDKAEIKLVTDILNPQDEKIAQVTTTWQLKDWDKTSF